METVQSFADRYSVNEVRVHWLHRSPVEISEGIQELAMFTLKNVTTHDMDHVYLTGKNRS